MKKYYLYISTYMGIMGIGLFVLKIFFNVLYTDSELIYNFLPVLIILASISLIFYFINKEDLKIKWRENRQYFLFHVCFLPVLFIATVLFIEDYSLSYKHLMLPILTLLIGIGEEVSYRKILFSKLLRQTSIKKAIIYSSLAFSILHTMNLFGGVSIDQMAFQLFSTFVFGIFFAVMYLYTHNIILLILHHSLWDYIFLSRLLENHNLLNIAMWVIPIIQIIIMLYLYKDYKNKMKKDIFI
ncbi:CPBP family intramembrane glutamic endopeptidase [Peptostreptococcus equinus]|uniref:Type II CAAX endopeptidase family protein n=1 Tax=Peptostreptococcus equinus TaxID=3003601 RepID=A0ABY7JPU7_9FIRM|nr:type II CAAX endopeptidase family protein [Peptostreptococcus sp. CBA3647]WAW15386.1 type II CAAX endopeptidase family protein [Peptostreptococcus sp. CBA3647]